jgi:hypothetical protein
MTNAHFPAPLLRLAGIAGILAGLFVISFAVIADSNNLFFFIDVYSGGSVEPWIQSVKSSPILSKFMMALPVIGFSCFLIVGVVLFQYIQENSWQKNLGIVGYSIGVPLTLTMWIIQLSLMNHVLLSHGHSPETDLQISSQVSLILYFFHIINEIFGPLFCIVLGSGMMAWAALKAKIFPKWFCYIGMSIALLMAISFLSVVNPAIRVLSTVAPLHMIWFIILGIYLLKSAK